MSSSGEVWFALPLNPEPWAVGPLGVARRGGKLTPYMGRNQQLDAYKEAVREELLNRYPAEATIYPPYYDLAFYFWRNRAEYEGENKTVRKNIVDATNMQKATEDALQGVLIENDRMVNHVSSTIVDQGPDVAGALAFRLRWGGPAYKDPIELPPPVAIRLASFAMARPSTDNEWPPRR